MLADGAEFGVDGSIDGLQFGDGYCLRDVWSDSKSLLGLIADHVGKCGLYDFAREVRYVRGPIPEAGFVLQGPFDDLNLSICPERAVGFPA